jgi:hypothetical protein
MFTGLLNRSFDLYSNAITSSDVYGGQTRTPVIKLLNVPCHFTYLTGREQALYGKRNIQATHVIFCDPTDVKSTDLVYVEGLYWSIQYIHLSGLDHDNHMEILIRAVNAPQDIQYEYGWTWGEQNPSPQLPVSWRNWTFENTLNEATNTGAWGELELTSTLKFVSDVKDTGDTSSKQITISYDDYDICTFNSGKIIWWRGQNTSFSQDDALIPWTLYNGTINTSLRYLQIRAGIY